MVAVLFPICDEEPKLDASALEELSSLGVTSVALLRDSTVAGLVLEGWAFDARDVERAARAIAGTSDEVRTLRPLAQMSVSAAGAQGPQARVTGDRITRSIDADQPPRRVRDVRRAPTERGVQ